MKTIYLAGGCFWGVQKYFDQFDGVIETETGYANGDTEDPTYREVCEGAGHAETVKITYDEEVLPTEKLLGYFFDVIDPLAVNKQGPDVGVQYRTGIYFDAEAATDPVFMADVKAACIKATEEAGAPLATELGYLQNYWTAEEYHQKYLDKNPGGYCHIPREKMRMVAEEKAAYKREFPDLPILVILPMNDERKEQLEMAAEEGVKARAAMEDREGLPPKWQPVFTYTTEEDLMPEDLLEAKVVIGNAPPAFYRAGFAPELLWNQGAWAGTEHMTAPGIVPDDVILTSAVGAYGLTVSEHMLAQTFDLIRHFHRYHEDQLRHEWKVEGPVTSVEGSRILILGMGNIGNDYARKVKALGAYTIGVRKSNKPRPAGFDEQYLMEDLDELLPTADIVAMVLPGGEETTGVMDEHRLRLMKEGAYLINVGRGTAIDQEALKKVMREGHLGGAHLDVMMPEPLDPDDELWDIPNLVITPHVAGRHLLPETVNRIVNIAARNLPRFLTGRPLVNLVEHGTPKEADGSAEPDEA